MAQGTNTDPNFLWHGNVKINTDTMGFNFKFHVAEKPEADAKIALLKLAALQLLLMPGNSEIVYATVSKDNTAKDSRAVRGALGVGAYVTAAGPPPVPALYNRPDDALLIRFEHLGGGSVTRKIGPLPDTLVVGGNMSITIADVDAPVVAAPAEAAPGDAWEVLCNKFMKAFMFYTQHLQSGHQPGTGYTYFPWTAAYVLRVGRKKGGRVLV